MKRAEIQTKLTQILVEQLGFTPEEVIDDAYFHPAHRDPKTCDLGNTPHLGADSLDMVEIIMALEEEFAITIQDEEIDRLQTVRQTIDYLETRLA